MACCKECNVKLVAGYKGEGNWNPTFAKRNYRLCKPCWNKKYNSTTSARRDHLSHRNPITNANMLYIDGKYISRKDPRYKMFRPGCYKTKDGLLEVSNISTNKKEGYIYILVNPHFDNWVKIGMAEDVTKRLAQFNTAYPERDGQMIYNVKVSNMRKAEKIAHKTAKKIANRTENEWFTLTVKQAVDILNRVESKGIEKKKEQVQPAIQDLFSHAKTGT
tara:strand:- start:359 stop:1015 length:657 start_codon:yes stop_codon:yes gene_type:complete